MAYTDITKPVVFNVSVQLTPKIDNYLRRMCIVSIGATTLQSGESKIVDVNTYRTIMKNNADTSSEFARKMASYFAYSNNKPVNVLEVSIAGDATANTVENQVKALEKYIDDGLTRCYMYLVPSAWYIASSPFAATVLKYNAETSQQYFMIEAARNTDPTTDSVFTQFKNFKSLFCVYDNSDDEFIKTKSLPGSILGLIGSSKFDISPTNKASPLNFKTLNSYQFKPLERQFIKHLIDAPLNFVFDEVGLPTLANGRYTNGDTFEYWYQWDLTQTAVNNKLTTMIVNGANNPAYAIRYNQQGIDILAASVKSVLAQQINLGAITDFAKGVDPVTNDLVEPGDIEAIPFAEYITTKPEDYKAEIYSGISFYILIGRYIRQVVINVTLN